MHFRLRILGTVLLLLSFCEAAGAASGRPFRFDELAKAGRVGGFSVSRDGQWLVYTVGTPDVEENRTRSALWLQPLPTGEPRRLTSGQTRDSDPAFSPDGSRIAFLSNRDGGSQIYLLDLTGGEPAKASSFPTDVNGFGGRPTESGSSSPPTSSPIARRRLRREESSGAGEGENEGARRRAAPLPALGRLEGRLRTHIWKAPVSGPPAAVDLTPATGTLLHSPSAAATTMTFVDGKTFSTPRTRTRSKPSRRMATSGWRRSTGRRRRET